MISDSDIEAHDELCELIARINKFITAASMSSKLLLHMKLYLHEKRDSVEYHLQPFWLEIWSANRPIEVGAYPVGFGETLEEAAAKILAEASEPGLLDYWEKRMVETIDKQSKLLKTLTQIYKSKPTT